MKHSRGEWGLEFRVQRSVRAAVLPPRLLHMKDNQMNNATSVTDVLDKGRRTHRTASLFSHYAGNTVTHVSHLHHYRVADQRVGFHLSMANHHHISRRV